MTDFCGTELETISNIFKKLKNQNPKTSQPKKQQNTGSYGGKNIRMVGFRCFNSALAKKSRAENVLARVKIQKFKKFKKVQRSSKKFKKVQKSSKKFKVQKIQHRLPAREYLSSRHHAQQKKQKRNHCSWLWPCTQMEICRL